MIDRTEIVELQPDEKIRQTGAATLYKFGERNVWMPKSQITEIDEDTIECGLWLVIKKELEGYIV